MKRNIIWGSTRFNFRNFFAQRFIYDLFYFLRDCYTTNYANDSTPYNADRNIEFVVNNLEHSSSVLFKRLNKNYMEVNNSKSHLLVSGKARAAAKSDNDCIASEKEQKLL